MALYLKYRPKDFDSLVGQDFIKNTLKEAVKNNKLVGAYLFCGPRGTGKTSTARILAKAINCNNLQNGNPCNECDICKAINNESLVDVIEIDAASNTGVDNIREIINKAQFRPTNARYKVYIIDEVHMLSTGAFNALLKILEEPPKYLKFILATTETHKVPETIISRCQRYDFKNISENDLRKRLEYIAGKEGINIDEKSLNYIIKNSAGGLRNAISLFEQLIVNSEIKYENLIENLGLVKEEELNIFLEKLLKKDNSIIDDYEKLINLGKNIKLFFKELIFFIKENIINDLKNNKNYSEKLKIIEILDETYSKTKNSLDENTTFLIGILKIITNNIKEIQANTIKQEKNKTEEKSRIQDKCVYSEIEENQIEEKQNLDLNDIEDIFGTKEEQIEEKRLVENKKFNKEEFISKLKDLKVKGSLTMSLRGADFILNGNILEIKFKTSFALNQVNKADNIAFIKKALEELGYIDININLT